MDGENTSLIGLARFKPSQHKYKDGYVYISVMITEGELRALDIRYFLEKENELTPTRNGYRIPAESIANCVKILLAKPPSILDEVCHYTKSREIHARYVDDKYGEAIDVRYYKKANDYTGWEKRGLRLRIQDYMEFQKLLGMIDFNNIKISGDANLFNGKTIVDTNKKSKRARDIPGKKEGYGRTSRNAVSNVYINEALQEIIE